MIEITPNQVAKNIRSLFRKDEPQAPRCFNVLDGVIPAGKILTDNAENPRWAAVQEPHDNSLYFGGHIDADLVRAIVTKLRRGGDVLIGMWLASANSLAMFLTSPLVFVTAGVAL